MEFHTTNDYFSDSNTEETSENIPCDFDENEAIYAELRKQILLLTAEEDEEELQASNNSRKPGDLLQKRLKNINPVPRILQHGCYYYDWSGDESAESVPALVFKFWKTGHGHGHGTGTGVFIPQIVNSRRRQRLRRKNNDRGRMYRPVASLEA